MSDDADYLRRQMDQALIDTQQQHWLKLTDIAERQVDVQSQLTTLSRRFVDHIEEESGERKLLQTVAAQLEIHTIQLSWIERMQYALWGAVGMLAAGGAGWIITFLGQRASVP